MKLYSWANKRSYILGLLFLIVLWQVFAIIINQDIYLPTLNQVFCAIINIVKDINFNINILSSVLRTFISFSVAAVIAIILGILSCMYPFFKDFFEGFNVIGKTIPTMVLVVLSLIWFDKDNTPYIVGIAIVFPIIYTGICNQLNKVEKEYSDLCFIYQISKLQKVKKIYLPVIIIYLAETFISDFSLAFKVVIAGEVHGQPTFGIGSAIQRAKINFEISKVFGWIVLIAIVSIILEAINKVIIRKIKKWDKK